MQSHPCSNRGGLSRYHQQHNQRYVRHLPHQPPQLPPLPYPLLTPLRGMDTSLAQEVHILQEAKLVQRHQENMKRTYPHP